MISRDTAILLLKKYYPENSITFGYLYMHSISVAELAVQTGKNHPELDPDIEFLHTASLLHDIGIFMTHAPQIGCYGIYPYLAHGYLGRELLEREGYPRHALVCERHVGVGISKEDVLRDGLPLPQRDMMPISVEEEIICFADKFYSKNSRLRNTAKDPERILKKLRSYGPEKEGIFRGFMKKYG